jgi:hypothetical protein
MPLVPPDPSVPPAPDPPPVPVVPPAEPDVEPPIPFCPVVSVEELAQPAAKARPIEVVTSKVRLERCKASSSCGWLIM